MNDPLDPFRREAKALKSAYDRGDANARARVEAIVPAGREAPLKHADVLHVIARENTFFSWPVMKAAIEAHGLDTAQKRQRLKIALHNRQSGTAMRLMQDAPDLAAGDLGLLCALYDRAGVETILDGAAAAASDLAKGQGEDWPPLAMLCKSTMFNVWPHKLDDMRAIAERLLAAGADVNGHAPRTQEPSLSMLYWALGHAGNMDLAEWLLANGADPDDNESLYHATELGHPEGVALLLRHGVTIEGTNALKRAMDFDDLDMVQMLLDAGADPNEGDWGALHHAALRKSSGAVCEAIMAAGADAAQVCRGVSAYVAARVYGNDALAALMPPAPLTDQEALLADAATGQAPDGAFINPATVPDLFLDLVREFAGVPGKLAHLKALIKIGMPWDRPDPYGLTPVQIAGWEGRPDMLAYFLSLKPDMGHVNGYGGTLFSTILHGSERNGDSDGRDYIGCLRLALEAGVALPRKAPRFVGRADIRDFLTDWAKAHPGQVVEHGVV